MVRALSGAGASPSSVYDSAAPAPLGSVGSSAPSGASAAQNASAAALLLAVTALHFVFRFHPKETVFPMRVDDPWRPADYYPVRPGRGRMG